MEDSRRIGIRLSRDAMSGRNEDIKPRVAATKGVAKEVRDLFEYVLVAHVETISTPGAGIWTDLGPKFDFREKRLGFSANGA